uniref:Coiled-coil serine-rich protein 2a n=1 Tax=Gadus morhua TaxID=8049 RepID=A0A8C5C1Y2_GADMO
MEEKPFVGIAMVSRLPKFGGRSSAGGASSLPNGSPQSTLPSQDTKTTTTATHMNGLVRKPSFSLKWRREACSSPSPALPPTSPTSPEDVKPQEVKPQTPLLLRKEGKNATPGTPTIRRSGSSLLSVSSPKAIPKQTSKTPSTKLAQSPLGAPKANHNGCNSPLRPRPMSGLALPKGTSSLHFSGSQDSLSLSSDSIKNMSMDNMVRSHSFTHFKQIPSPTNQPMTRSFSFNRAVELAKPLANTTLRPPQASFLKPPQASATATSVSSLSNNTASTPTTPTALKKPLLPSCMTAKPLGGSNGGYVGCKLARPRQTKLQKPLFMGRVKGDARPVTAPGCPGGKSGKEGEDQDTGEIIKADLHIDVDYSVGEALEDMSLSSASSVERGDTSEDFLEDVDSGADTFSDGDTADTKTGSSTQLRLRSFLNETMEWSNLDAAGGKEDVALQDSKCSPLVSPERGDLLQGSSLELSPSNSSGGTYMWDEEGLEPLGGAGIHPCDSYDDSELNSLAILNHLEPLSIEDLDDDDLMLELDLPEDVLLHQGPVFQHYDGPRAQGSIRGPPQPQQPASREDDRTLGANLPDELTLKHMAQDYSSLKNQLLKLQTILQVGPACSEVDVYLSHIYI